MGIFLAGSLVQTIILINNENYAFPSWQGTLLAFASMLIAFIGSVYGAKVLPYWQTTVFAVHVLGFLAYIVPIWINAPRASHQQVWAEFQNEGGWSSMGLSLMVGQLAGISQQVGIDTVSRALCSILTTDLRFFRPHTCRKRCVTPHHQCQKR